MIRYAKNVDNYTEGERYALLKKIVQRANKGGNITVQSYGVENIPNENGFMFYPNHQGLYDVLAIVDVCPTPFSVVHNALPLYNYQRFWHTDSA